MKSRETYILVAMICILAFSPAIAAEIVLTFEDLPTQFPGYLPSGYAGLKWDNYYDAPDEFSPYWLWGSESSNPSYSEPHSVNNYLINAFGFSGLGFALPNPDTSTLSGAWFTQTNTEWTADYIRFDGYDSMGNLTEQSAWLTLSLTPRYLEANFGPVSWIIVERSGERTGTYFTMDDLTYNTSVPEPATLLLFALGGIILRRKK
ncbi:MAG: PEP-CTERM sorting domain-containing protein [Sedimentisphaerales bacterium]